MELRKYERDENVGTLILYIYIYTISNICILGNSVGRLPYDSLPNIYGGVSLFVYL